MRSDQVNDGWFLAIQYKTGKAATERKNEFPIHVRAVAEARKINLRYRIIVRCKLSIRLPFLDLSAVLQ